MNRTKVACNKFQVLPRYKHLLLLYIYTLVYSTIIFSLSSHAQNNTLKPLLAEQSNRPTSSSDSESEHLYYYSGGQKIYLYDTGLASVKMKEDAEPDDLELREMFFPNDESFQNLTESLKNNNLFVVESSVPNGVRFRDIYDQNSQFEYILPICKSTAFNMIERESNVGSDSGYGELAMIPYIIARFSNEVNVEEFISDVGLGIFQQQENVPNGYLLQLNEAPVTYTKLIKAANTLYEKGKESGEIIYSHPDFRPKIKFYQNASTPLSETRFGNQWHLENRGQQGGLSDADVDIQGAWSITRGNPDILVAIIDDSVQKDHPSLVANYQAGRYYRANPRSTNDDPSPRSGDQKHGTACAGVAVGSGTEGGIWGAAPECGLIGIHFWDSSVAQVSDAFRWADNQGADVISCSWGWEPAFDATRNTINELYANGRNGLGSVILFAAGNEFGEIELNQEFGTLESVFSIGATDWRDVHSAYSNHGLELDVVAPSSGGASALRIDTSDNSDHLPHVNNKNYSGYILGEYTDTGRFGFGGTSSATPLTAGICALVLSVNENLTSTQVRSIIEHTTDRVRGETRSLAKYDVTTSHDVRYGYGRVNAKNAVLAAQKSLTNIDAVWPDHVSQLEVSRVNNDQRSAQLKWSNPRDNVEGVLVVRSNDPLQWKPHDGDRYQIGDRVGKDGRIINVKNNQTIIDQFSVIEDIHYTVFVYNRDYKYSWGKVVILNP